MLVRHYRHCLLATYSSGPIFVKSPLYHTRLCHEADQRDHLLRVVEDILFHLLFSSSPRGPHPSADFERERSPYPKSEKQHVPKITWEATFVAVFRVCL